MNLDGTVTDDNFPSNPLTTTWTVFSGPGAVTFGDASSVDTTATFSQAGTYVLRLTAADGQFSVSDDVQIVVNSQVAGPAVTSFTLINADTNLPLGIISNGQTINLAELPTQHINVRADTVDTLASVRFDLDGQVGFRTENTAPFSLFGDNNGNYSAGSFSLGSHTLTATPFSSKNANGTAGTPLTVVFNVTSNSEPSNQGISESQTAFAAAANLSADEGLQFVTVKGQPELTTTRSRLVAAVDQRLLSHPNSNMLRSALLNVRDRAFSQWKAIERETTSTVAAVIATSRFGNRKAVLADFGQFDLGKEIRDSAFESLTFYTHQIPR